jgi:hypothetical protein
MSPPAAGSKSKPSKKQVGTANKKKRKFSSMSPAFNSGLSPTNSFSQIG